MLEQAVLSRLPSAAMTAEEDLEAKRRGYWLKRARELAGITQADAAVTIGLDPSSGSTVSLIEKGERPIKVHQMKRLATRYGVPASLFIDPPETDEERLAELVRGVTDVERRDHDAGREVRPDDEAASDEALDRRPA